MPKCASAGVYKSKAQRSVNKCNDGEAPPRPEKDGAVTRGTN